MKSINSKKERMSVQLQRLLMMMATIMMAFATLTACEILEDNNDENGKEEEEGGNGGGGVSGKRLKSSETNSSSPLIMYSKSVCFYNNNGQCIRSETYDASSKLISTTISTYNSNGTLAKTVTNNENDKIVTEVLYSYNSNKTLQKSEDNFYLDGKLIQTTHWEYTFENGKKISQKYHLEGNSDYGVLTFNYDGNGRRTTTVLNYYGGDILLTMTYTRTYNSDGTVQKLTYPVNFVDNTPVTVTFTWENGKDAIGFDMYNPW